MKPLYFELRTRGINL